MKLEIICAIRNSISLIVFAWLAHRFDKWYLIFWALVFWCWVKDK